MSVSDAVAVLTAVLHGDAAEAKRILAGFDWHDFEEVEMACKDLMFWVEDARVGLEKKEEREKVIKGARELLHD